MCCKECKNLTPKMYWDCDNNITKLNICNIHNAIIKDEYNTICDEFENKKCNIRRVKYENL